MIGIDISNIRNIIVNGIKEYTEIDTVDTDNPHTKPKYPYYSYKLINLYNPDQFEGVKTYKSSDTLKEVIIYQPQLTISFNSYSNDVVKANQAVLKAWEWFKFVGYEDLKMNNIVVIDVMPIQDRTTFMTTGYEYRQGFDVVLRTTHRIEREVDTIEKYEFKESDNI